MIRKMWRHVRLGRIWQVMYDIKVGEQALGWNMWRNFRQRRRRRNIREENVDK